MTAAVCVRARRLRERGVERGGRICGAEWRVRGGIARGLGVTTVAVVVRGERLGEVLTMDDGCCSCGALPPLGKGTLRKVGREWLETGKPRDGDLDWAAKDTGMASGHTKGEPGLENWTISASRFGKRCCGRL